MEKTDKRYGTYVQILKEELVPAMGCTEPIAIAYAAAKAREILGALPDKVEIGVSGNIIKNVKSVVVPNTDGLKGIQAAAAAGIVGGKSEKQLEVIAEVTPEQKKEMKDFLKNVPIQVDAVDNGLIFDIIVKLHKKDHSSLVRIAQYHTNIVLIQKDEKTLYEAKKDGGAGCQDESKEVGLADKNLLNIRDILDFANTCDIEDVKPMLDPQIQCNTAISEEGLLGNYGANIGSVLLKTYGSDIKNRAVAKAAAGSDARMNGCELPVVINSGSGNQGITVSVPVIEYAKELNVSKEKLYRALTLSNLIAIHEKTGIGRLSAYCGAVSAGCAAGCGIAYLHGEGYDAISHTLVNSLAIVSGIICDGAKASCAAKIASSVEAGLLGYSMYKSGNEFKSGDGIVNNGVEATIRNVSQLGREGMRETDKEIIKIMLAPLLEEKNKEDGSAACAAIHLFFYYNLAAFHGFQGCLMTFRCDTGTAAAVHPDLHFWQSSLQQQCIAHHTDVRAQADQFDAADGLFPVQFLESFCQLHRTERRLLDHGPVVFLLELFQPWDQPPARRPFDAVFHRQPAAFLGLQIICAMGVLGENHLPGEGSHFFQDGRSNGLGRLRP